MAQLTEMRKDEKESGQNRVCIVVSKGSLDMVAAAFFIGNTASTMGSDVHYFFTFWGLKALTKQKVGSLQVSPVGNPGMPMPNILGMIPGMTAMATRMMTGAMKKTKTPTIPEMFRMAKELGGHIHACSTSMPLLGVKKEDLIPEVEDIIGAATFLSLAQGGQTIFI
jgi:peroxiredoxin family protein